MASDTVVEAKSTPVERTGGKVTKTTTIPLPQMGKSSPSSPTPATDTIVICMLVIMGTSLVKDTAKGTPTVRPIVTGMLLGGVLLIVGTFAPTLAKMLAIFGMIGSLMTNGLELTQTAGKITAPPKTAAATPTTGTTLA